MFVRTKSGFVALITVLIVTAVSLIIGTTILLKAITHASMSSSEIFSAEAWTAANSCVEYALGQFSATTSAWTTYTGGNTLNLGGNNCYIFPITATGTSQLIKASSTVSSFVRKLQVVVATNTPQSVVSSWQEVGDF